MPSNELFLDVLPLVASLPDNSFTVAPSSKLRLVYFIPLTIILIVGILFAVLRPEPVLILNAGASKDSVKDGKNYYVFVRSLEVAPKKPSGKSWDRVSDEAPDLYYEVHRRDNRIFASTTQDDQLIATWSPLGVDTLKSIREGRLSVDSVIKAAAIRAAQGESFELRFFDQDPFSKDSIGILTFKFSELEEGDNEFTYTQSEDNSVTHLRLAVVDADHSLVSQIEKMINPQS